MGKLPGISKLDFDCKTATVTMKDGATIARETFTKTLTAAGFGVSSFSSTAPPMTTAYVFQVSGLEPGKHGAARDALRAALGAADRVSVDATGAAVVTLAKDSSLDQKTVAAALKRSGLGLEGFAVREWPKACAVYEITIPEMTDAAAAGRARKALVSLEKTLDADVYPEEKRAVIRLNEPCDAIEVNAREALGDAGLSVSAFRLEKR